MITFVKGILVEATPLKITLDVHGIGYGVYIPANAFSQLPQLHSDLLLHTSFVIREFSQALYGFITSQERDAFEVLLDVSGVGPKLALSIVGHLSLRDLQAAVANRELGSLCKVPGIGKKTAERLIIELRDKLQGIPSGHTDELAVLIPANSKDQHISDAMRALINLGYNQLTAQKAIKQSLKDLPEEINLAELITASLKNV